MAWLVSAEEIFLTAVAIWQIIPITKVLFIQSAAINPESACNLHFSRLFWKRISTFCISTMDQLQVHHSSEPTQVPIHPELLQPHQDVLP